MTEEKRRYQAESRRTSEGLALSDSKLGIFITAKYANYAKFSHLVEDPDVVGDTLSNWFQFAE